MEQTFVLHNYNHMLEQLRQLPEKPTVAVAAAADKMVLECIARARKENAANAILVGPSEKIISILRSLGENPSDYDIEATPDDAKIMADTAVELIKREDADFLMKGLIETSDFLRPVVKKENNLRTGRTMSHLAFNALPAAISDDMWTHQYDQQVNQIACMRFPGKPSFRTNGEEANLFGLEPHFGCCTANLHQGWPKLAWNIFLQDQEEIECSLMLPAEFTTQISGVPVRIRLITEYPFRHTCQCVVETDQPVEFQLKIRIPKWSKQYEVDGEILENHGYLVKKQRWEKKQTLTIRLFDEPHLTNRPLDLKTAEYGPMVFALPITAEYKMYEYVKDGVERKFPYCDYELIPRSEWRFGYAKEKLQVCEKTGDEVPFSSKNPRLTLRAEMQPVEWEYEDGYETVAAVCPNGKLREGKPEIMELYPYGCAKLRMTELPLMSKADTM